MTSCTARRSCHARGMVRPVPVSQQRDDDHLRQRHHRAGDAGGTLHAELNGKRPHAHALVALDGLEVIERHDAVGAQRIEQRQDQDRPGRNAAQQSGRTGEPRQAFIAETHREIAPPAILLEAQRRCRIGPGGGAAEAGGPEHDRTDQRRNGKRQERPDNRDIEPPAARHAAGGDGPVRLIDGIDVAVIPVIDGLAHAADERPGKRNSGKEKRPVGNERHTRRHRPATKGPHGRKPGDRLQQLEHRARAGMGRHRPG